MNRLRAGRPGVRIPIQAIHFFFYKKSRPALGLNQFPTFCRQTIPVVNLICVWPCIINVGKARATLPRSEPLPTTTTGHYTTCCKKPQSYAPEDWQKFPRNMLSWSLEINKTVIVASRLFLFYLTYMISHHTHTTLIFINSECTAMSIHICPCIKQVKLQHNTTGNVN